MPLKKKGQLKSCRVNKMTRDLEKLRNYLGDNFICEITEDFYKSYENKFGKTRLQFEDLMNVILTNVSKKMRNLGFEFNDFDYRLSNAGNDLKLEIFRKEITDDKKFKKIVSVSYFPYALNEKLNVEAGIFLSGAADVLSKFFSNGCIKANPMLNFEKFKMALNYLNFDYSFKFKIGNNGEIGELLYISFENELLLSFSSNIINYKKEETALLKQLMAHLDTDGKKMSVSADRAKVEIAGSVNEREVKVKTFFNDYENETEILRKLFSKEYKAFEYCGDRIYFKYENDNINKLSAVKKMRINFGINQFMLENGKIEICHGSKDFIASLISLIQSFGKELLKNEIAGTLIRNGIMKRERNELVQLKNVDDNFPKLAVVYELLYGKGKFENEETLKNILKIAEYLPENMEYSFGKYRIRKGKVERNLGNTGFATFSEGLRQYLDESGNNKNFVFTATGSYAGDRLTYNPSSGLEFISKEHFDLWENLEPKFRNLSKEMNTYLFARTARYEAMFEKGQKVENIGTDPERMKKQVSEEVLNEIRKALSENKNIMILGETGSGKETFNDFILDHFGSYRRLRKTISIKEIRKGKEIAQMIDIFFKPIYEKHKYIFGLNLSYDGILKERISVTEKAILKMKQYLPDPDVHYSNEKEKKKIIELLEKFVKNSLVIHLKKDEEKGYTQEIVALPEYENK
jgi:hypothetical protein